LSWRRTSIKSPHESNGSAFKSKHNEENKEQWQDKLSSENEKTPAPHQPTDPNYAHSFSKISVHSPFPMFDMKNTSKTANSCQLQLGNPKVCPLGGACHVCPNRVQYKLMVGKSGDDYEQEADSLAKHAAENVETTPKNKSISKKQQDATFQRKCKLCEDEENLIQKKEASIEPQNSSEASLKMAPIIEKGLYSSGTSLDRDTLNFMESRLNYDFKNVRVHTDSNAAESARMVNALAFTVGQDVVFGQGQYQPALSSGQFLLAHELVHVVQQQNSSRLQTKLPISSVDNETEYEADELSENVMAGKNTHVSRYLHNSMIQRQACRSLLDEPEIGRVRGIDAHAAILDDFTAKNGANAVRIRIPAGSSEFLGARCGDDPQIESPLKYGGKKGDGIPDLEYKTGEILEVAEIKPASWECYPDGQQQVQNYLDKGNYPDAPFEEWRKTNEISRVRHMETNRYSPTSPLPVQGQNVSVMWCEAGLLAYKVVRHPEVLVCGAISDKGQLDIFLERSLGQTQGAVDSFINDRLEPVLDAMISRMSMQEALGLLYRFSKNMLKEFIAKQVGGGPVGKTVAETVTENLPDEKAVAALAKWIDEQIGPKAQDELRKLMQRFKITLITEIRLRMQRDLRTFMQETLTVLCATAISVSASMLMKRIYQDMARYFTEKLVEIMADVAKAFVEAFAEALAYALLAVAAVAVVIAGIFLAPEIIAFAAAAIAELTALLATLGPLLSRFVLPRLIPVLAP
jgi:hypothetical protein